MIEEYAQFITATILRHQHLLLPDKNKKIIISSLKYLVENKKIELYGYVIMSNHIHLIWQVLQPHNTSSVMRDFLKYTAQQFLKELRNCLDDLENYRVDKKDRKYQVWERNSWRMDLWSQSVFDQKMDYIHNNPVTANLCEYPEAYRYSSARFYENEYDEFDIITHYEE